MENDRDMLLISIFTLFTVSFWIFFELVKTTRTSTISEPIEQIIQPLSPGIDTGTLNLLEERKTY